MQNTSERAGRVGFGRSLNAKALMCALAVLALLGILWGQLAWAVVSGTAPTRYRSFRLFGNAVATGNTLMSNTPSQPLVNSILLSSSGARIQGVPQGATIEGAFLFWSGSIQNQPDRQAGLTLADGFRSNVSAETCFSSPTFDGSFYCRADVTSLVAAHPRAAGNFNGLYTVSDVNARAAALDENGQCLETNCQAYFAGWSLVLVYSAPNETTQRDIVLYDGFRLLDETNDSAGIDNFTIDGFEVANPPQGTFTFFGMEGDALLGVPPQDQDGNPDLRCSDCVDFIELNGTRLSDANNPPGNLFNSTTPAGGALGVDIDTYDVSSIFRTGDSTARIRVGSGDGRPSFQGGGGEAFFLGYVMLSLNRLAPNFGRNTTKVVDPEEAGPGETVFFDIRVTNDGSQDATQTIVTDILDSNFVYVAGSTRVDGVAVADVGGRSPLAAGLRLGTIPSTGDNDRRISFRATVRQGVAAGTRIPNTANVRSAEVTDPFETNTVFVTVDAPSLGQPTKSFRDVNGGEVAPGDTVEYTVFIPNESGRTASAVSFVDDMSPFVRLVSVARTTFDDRSDPDGGINGTGRVDIRDITIPGTEDGVFLSYNVRVLSAEELLALGIAAEDIDGLAVDNQGRVQASFLTASLLTDDPRTAARPDPTIFRLSSAIQLRNNQTFKRVEDVNGGNLAPGDTLRYTIRLNNTGSAPAQVNLSDDMPPGVRAFVLETPRAEASFAPAPAGGNATGRLTVRGLTVGAGARVELVFTVQVADDAPGGLRIQNLAELEVPAAPDQDQDLASAALTVVAGPDLTGATKEIVGAPVGGFQPGDEVTYRISVTNAGTQAARGVQIQDDVAANLQDVTPADGGVFDAGRRRITWTLGDLDAGETAQVEFTAQIAGALPNGTQIRNQGVVSASNLVDRVLTDDPTTATQDDATVLTVRSTPSLTASTKEVVDLNGGDFEPGDEVRYTITLRNDGRDSARQLMVVDDVDANLTVTTVGQGGALAGRRVTWMAAGSPDLAELAPGEEVALTFQARVAAPLANGTSISNQGRITSIELPTPTVTDDPTTPTPDDPTIFSIRATPSLTTSTKEVLDENGGSVQPGDALTYTITLRNDGNGLARGVVVSDPVDPNLTGVTPADGGVFDAGAGTITWTLAGPVEAGQETTVEFQARVLPGTVNGTVIRNQATITGTDLPAPVLTDDPRDGVDNDNPTEVTVEARPDFVLSTKFVRNESREEGFQPGDTISYLITVRNTGTQDAQDVSVRDALPAELEDAQVVGGALVGNDASWSLPTVAAGEEVELEVRGTLRGEIDDGTQVSNQAFITSAEVVDPVPTDNPNTAEEDDATVFVVSSRAVLSASRKTFVAPQDPVRPGDEITWTIEVINTGSGSAREAVVSDVIDASLVDVQPLDGGVFDEVTRTITWDSAGNPALASVAADPNSATALRFVARVASPLDNGTIISNQAQVQALGLPEPALTDDPRTAELGDPTSFPVVSAAGFTGATKTVEAQPDGEFNPGDTVRYVISFTNNGDSAATNVFVEDVLDENLIFARASDGGRLQAPLLRWDAATTPALGRVEPGQSVQLSFEAVLTAPIPTGTIIFNQARVAADGFVNAQVTDDPATPALDDPTLFEVRSASELGGATKEVRDLDGDGVFEPGDELEYAITVRNAGDDVARNVVVRDIVDTVGLVDVRPLDGGRLDGGTITWDGAGNPALVELAPGEAARRVLRFRATVGAVENRAEVVNQATVSADGVEGVVTDDPTTAEVDDATRFVVVSAPRFDGASKTVEDLNGGLVQGADRLRYALTVRNEGTQVGRAVVVSDPIDANLVDVVPQDGGALVGGQVVWNLGDVPAGEERVVRFEASVRPDAADGTAISNQGQVSADELVAVLTDDPTTPAEDDATVVIVNAQPDLSLFTKSVTDLDGGFLRPGDEVEFLLTLRNTGLGAAREVVVRDPVDTSLLTDVVAGQGGRVRAGVVTWTQAEVAALAQVNGGDRVELTIRARVRPDLVNGTVVLNQANLASAEVPQELSDDPSTGAENDPTRVLVSFPEFARFTKEVEDLNGGLVEAGDELRYRITVEAGAGPALTNVQVVDPWPARLLEPRPSAGGFFDANLGAVVWRGVPALARLVPGRPVVLEVTGRIDLEAQPGDVISNQASATTPEDPALVALSDDPRNGLGDFDPTVLTVERPAVADLRGTTKTVRDLNGGLVEPGDTLQWTITIPNRGNASSGAMTLVDPTPALAVYVPGSARVDGRPAVDPDGGSPLAQGLALAEVLPGESRVVTFETVVYGEATRGLILSNQASVTTDTGLQVLSDDPTTANPDDATQVVVGAAPNLSGARKTARTRDLNGNGVFEPGEPIEYEIRVSNRGTTAATRVAIRDVLPENVRYLPGTLRANGVEVSDAQDDDFGSVVGGQVEALVGTVEPGEVIEVRFQVQALRGSEVVNQGTISGAEFGDERTDADGNEANGDQPTVVYIGSKEGRLRVTKAVSDSNGGPVEPGDELLYTVQVTNLGDQSLEGVRLEDALDDALGFVGATTPVDAVVSGEQTILVDKFLIPGGETRVVTLRARLSQEAPLGQEVCNVASVTVPNAEVPGVSSESVCVTVGGTLGAAQLTGQTFEDIGERDGVLGEGDDLIEDFLVRMYRPDDLTRAIGEATTDQDGRYGLPLVGAGRYVLKTFSRPVGGEPVEFARAEVVVSEGAVTRQDLLVDPSGRLYNSVTGELLSGVKVNLYYDDTDPDTTRAGKLVAPQDMREGQQGQLSVLGRYRFDVAPGHLYRVEVVPTAQNLTFPSARIRPVERLWTPGEDPGVVVEGEVPVLGEAARYFLRFNIADETSVVVHNHIPLDPLTNLVVLDKRADRQTTKLGEVVTYTVQITNQSSRDLVYDEAAGVGGGYIQDLVPSHFRYVKGSARVRAVAPGQLVASEVAEPEGALSLRFGVRREGRLLPLSLPAGGSLELRYQLVAGVEVEPGKTYTNRAVFVTADGSTPVSNEDTASVRVVLDPIFDQGVIVGKVFCDANGDGWQDEGERGVYRARVYLDNGWYAVTDEAGKFHIQAVDPGTHLVKLDPDTLPPGATPTTDVRRVFYVTRGLPVKVSFGATCPLNLVDEVDVNASKALLDEQKRLMAESFLEVTGSVPERRVEVSGKALSMPSASMEVVVKGGEKGGPVAELSQGKLKAPIVFKPQAQPAGSRWAIQIAQLDKGKRGATVHTLQGEGEAPAEVSWSGVAGEGGPLVVQGPQVYVAQFVSQGAGGRVATSAPVLFGVAATQDLSVEETLRGEALWKGKGAELGDKLKDELKRLRGKADRARKPKFLLEVHTDDKGKPEELKALSQQRAQALKGFVVKELGVSEEDVEAVGYGSERALVPNADNESRGLNRRVEVKISDARPEVVSPKLPTVAEAGAEVFVNNKALKVEPGGKFGERLLRPEDGLLVIELRFIDGARSVARVNLRSGAVELKAPEVELPEVTVAGDLKAKTLTVGRKERAMPLLGLEVKPGQAEVSLEGGRLTPPVKLSTVVPKGVEVARYKVEVRDGNDNVLFIAAGDGAPRAEVSWSGEVQEDRTFLIPGWYKATLAVETEDGQWARSSVAQFRVVEPAPAKGKKPAPAKGKKGKEAEAAVPAAPPALSFVSEAFVQGARVEVGSDGGFRAKTRGYSGQKLVVEVQTQTGARAIMHVEVPEGFPKPLGLEAGQSVPVLELSEPVLKPVEEKKPEGEKPEGEKKEEEKKPADGEGEEAPEGALPAREGEVRVSDLVGEEAWGFAAQPRFTVLLAQGEPSSDAKPTTGGKPADAKGELGGFGGEALERALQDVGEVKFDPKALEAKAANLKVELPPQGVRLNSRELVVRGTTDPTNAVTINGRPVEVVEGSFVAVVVLPLGPSEVVVEASDVDGNKGVIRWPVEVADAGLFLMALGEFGAALEGASLDGLNGRNSWETDGGTLLFGQGRLYLKGYLSGREIMDGVFQEYRATVHADTSKQAEFEEFLSDNIQADQYYPIYGDSGETIRDANARGPLYVLLEADESKLQVGNVRAGLEGVQFFKYDRPFYGAKLDLQKTFAEQYKTEIKAFVADGGQQVRHTYNYLQGTGGSIYWLRQGEVSEGSERVEIVVRDAVSGVELMRVPQSRNVDYTIDYRTGRILFKSPIPSVTSGSYLGGQVSTTREVNDGNPVLVEVSYDYLSRDGLADGSAGVQGRETFWDALTLGGGYVKEGRGAVPGQPDYELWGVEGGLRYSDKTRLAVEYAQSRSRDSLALYSDDGGLTFDRFTRRNGRQDEGAAWLIEGRAELGDFLVGEDGEPEEILSVRGWFHRAERGFFAHGNALQQGQDKFGGEGIWKLDASQDLRLRHDGVFTSVDDFRSDDASQFKIVERQVTTLQHRAQWGEWDLTSEYGHSFYDDDSRIDGYNTDQLQARVGYRFTPELRAFVGQQWVVRGDPRIYDETLDQLQSEVGLEYRFFDDWTLEGSQVMRWNGENATQLGLSTQLSPDSRVYVRERLTTREDNHGVGSATVVGGESRFAEGTGRIYSEYQVDTGLAGDQTRAIVGIGKNFTLTKGITLDLAAERSQIKASGLTGESSRTVGSVGWEWLESKTFKLSQKVELRYDDAAAQNPRDALCQGDGVFSNPDLCRDNLPLGADRLQALASNSLVLTVWDDHSFLANFNVSTTQNLTTEQEEARHMVLSFGYALRPVAWDWLDVLVKYTYLQDLRPMDLTGWREEREHSHVMALVPMVELPWDLQVVGKLAFKRQFLRLDNLPEVESDTWLSLLRLNYHLTATFDASAEYRWLHNELTGQTKHGPLVELSYILLEHARLGVGYNFSSFSDDELSDLNRDAGGFFFRLQGQY